MGFRLPGLMLGVVSLLAAASLVGCSDDKGGQKPTAEAGNGAGGAADGEGGRDNGNNGGVPDLGQLGDDPAPEAAWTFLVYGHGDHNLSNSLLTDLQEMARAEQGEAGALNVLALTDWDASQAIAGSDPPQAFPEGIQLFRIPGGGGDLELLAEGAEANLDDPEVLAELVANVFAAFPSRRRAVVLWDHGGAWSGGFGSDSQNGTLASPVGMPAQAIPPALLAGLEAAGVTASPPLDIVGFDTCLMAGAEIVFPFRELASVFIGNAEIDYGAGWDYTATLTHLAENPADDAIDFAKAEVDDWQKHHVSASANDALLRSHVAIDLSAVAGFTQAASDLTRALSKSETFPATELGRSAFFALPPYASQFEKASSSAPGLRDFGQVLRALEGTDFDTSVSSAATRARTSLEGLVIARSQGSLRESSNQAGLHVELGLASQLSGDVLEAYASRASVWNDASGWSGMLSALVDAADTTGPTFEHSVQNADGASIAAPPTLDFSTIDADTAQGTIYLGAALDADTVALLGLVGSGTLEPASDYSFGWDGSVATFPDGQPAMLDIWLNVGEDAGEPVLMAPGVLSAGGEELQTYLVFTPSEGEATAAVVSLGEVASTLGLSEIVQAYPDATFTPTYIGVSVSSGATQVVSGDPFRLPASGTIAFSIEYLPAGTYLYFTSITDIWGNVTTEADAFELLEPLGE